MDQYCDEQAMTVGELSLLEKMYAYRTLCNSCAGYTTLYINLDASSWNNHFQRGTVDNPMSITLDRLFGTSIFSKTRLAYEKTFFFVPDEECTYHWDGQLGGIDGLNQYTQVIAYLGQIRVAMDGLGFKYHILCKEDDVRIMVLVPPEIL